MENGNAVKTASVWQFWWDTRSWL